MKTILMEIALWIFKFFVAQLIFVFPVAAAMSIVRSNSTSEAIYGVLQLLGVLLLFSCAFVLAGGAFLGAVLFIHYAEFKIQGEDPTLEELEKSIVGSTDID